MQGLHLTADLRGCPPAAPAMTDLAALRALCLDAVESAGLTAVGELFHRFDAAACAALMEPAPPSPTAPVGITGVVLLAESHLAVHTWPELGAATLDVYVCNFGGDNSMRAHALMDRLVARFEPTDVERHALTRGAPGSGAAHSGTGSATTATA